MNTQDITPEQAHFLAEKAGDLPIQLGYFRPETPTFDFSKRIPHSEDPRFVLGDLSPYHRKLVRIWENDEVLVGVFYVPENENQPYPLSAQYSIYYVDKANPEKDHGGGICPSEFCYPPVVKRDKGIDRGDFIKLQNFINEGLKIKGFKTQFPLEDASSYHVYWLRPEIDEPHPGKIGEDYRAPDGALRRLEAVFENEIVRVEVTAHVERYTELTAKSGYFYSIDLFQNGRCISGHSFQSVVQWPPLRERKFGIDYHDWMRIQEAVKQILDFREIRTSFPIVDDQERYVYFAGDKDKLDSIIVMKKRVTDGPNVKLVDFRPLVVPKDSE